MLWSGRLNQASDFRAVAKVMVSVCNGLPWKRTVPRISASGHPVKVKAKAGQAPNPAAAEQDSQNETNSDDEMVASSGSESDEPDVENESSTEPGVPWTRTTKLMSTGR